MRRPEALTFCAFVIAGQAWAQLAPIDNDRVTVRELILGPAGVELNHSGDHISVYLTGGKIGTNTGTEIHAAGEVVVGGAGREKLIAISGAPHIVVVDLKGGPATHPTNHTGYPLAFPRPGAHRLAQSPRFTVWSYDWQPGKPTPMHFHDKDVVVIYRGEGTLDSVTPDGKHTPTAHHMGETRFNKGNRAHFELLTSGKLGATMVELQ